MAILNMNDNGKRYSLYTFGDTSGRIHSIKASVACVMSTDSYIADYRIDKEAVASGVTDFESVLPDGDYAKAVAHLFERRPIADENGPWHHLFDLFNRYLGKNKWLAFDLEEAVRTARHRKDDSGLLGRYFKVSLDLENDAGEVERIDVATVMFS